MPASKPIGAKKFVLLHHSGCYRNHFHYRVDSNGDIERLVNDDLITQHPHSIAIQLMGDFDDSFVTTPQFAALKQLLLDLKLRYPAIEIGAHRQVRGDHKTTCPGKNFPMSALREWAKTNLLEERDDYLRDVIESQYHP